MTLPPSTRRSPDGCPDTATPPSGCASRRRGPSVEKTAQTQRQITEAALATFLAYGITGTTMAQIADRAGVGKGTIYSYFPSKQALLRGVVQHALAHSMVNQPPVQRRPGESVQSLLRRTLLPSMASIEHSDRGSLAQLILSEAKQHPELGVLFKELAYEPWLRQIQQLLALAYAEGELAGDALLEYAQLLGSPFWLAMVHNGLLTGDARQHVSIRPLVERLIALMFLPVAAAPAAAASSAEVPAGTGTPC